MFLNVNSIVKSITGAALAVAVVAGAQAPSTPAPAPAAPPTWSVGPMELSGLIDGYYSYNANRPTDAANGQINDLYNFNDKTDQFSLAEARLTLNHDPDPIGARVDFMFGRANTIMNGDTTSGNEGQFLEQAYMSFAPPKGKGFEMDFGKFVTSAGAEVIEAKDDWSYSRGILFAWAIPFYHFGLRTSMPVSKSETVGVQVVNGWNNTTKSNGGATIGLTSAFSKPKYSWFLNYYTGPENGTSQKGYRNLIDTTLTLSPSDKFNAYINYDYGQNRDNLVDVGDTALNHWQGVAFAAHSQVSATSSLTGRYEYFKDMNGYSTGTAQTLQEFTGTYEYKWAQGMLTRVEYRRDWSDQPFFHKGDSNMVDAQSTVTMGFIAFFGPKR